MTIHPLMIGNTLAGGKNFSAFKASATVCAACRVLKTISRFLAGAAEAARWVK
jgi:hypothetical protein